MSIQNVIDVCHIEPNFKHCLSFETSSQLTETISAIIIAKDPGEILQMPVFRFPKELILLFRSHWILSWLSSPGSGKSRSRENAISFIEIRRIFFRIKFYLCRECKKSTFSRNNVFACHLTIIRDMFLPSLLPTEFLPVFAGKQELWTIEANNGQIVGEDWHIDSSRH